MKTEDTEKRKMDKEEEHHLLIDTLSSPVKDPYYEKNLRVLQQVQEKRAKLLGLPDKDELTLARTFHRGNFGSQNKTSLEQNSKSQENSTPPPLHFSADLALTNDFRGHLVKPKPRHVSVVRPVQYPDRKICHPVPQALRRPPGSSPAYRADSRRLPPKKRPYTRTQEETAPSSEDDDIMASLSHSETSAFCKFLPDLVNNNYYQQLHNKKARLASEVPVAGNSNTVQTKRSVSLKELQALSNNLIEDDAELDREVAEILCPTPEMKTDYCPSPKEPWIPAMADDISEPDKRVHDMMSFIQKISPVVISLSRGNSPSSPISITSSPENSIDSPITVSSSLENSLSSPITIGSGPGNSPSNPVMISPTLGDHQFLEETRSIVSSSNITANVQIERPTYQEPGIHIIENLDASEDSSGRPKPTMEELRRMVLTTDRSADRPWVDKFTQTEEEQFAEILEDFLEENKCLPPDIRDIILDMLNKTRDTVAELKEGILYTAEIFMGESNTETSVTEFDRAPDDEVMQLINEIGLPDTSSFNTRESPAHALFDMLTNEREAMYESMRGTVYTTEVFIRTEDERLLEEFENAAEGGLPSENLRNTELCTPTVCNTSDSLGRQFDEIKFVDVEMESTGQGIYDEIADFFRYDDYTDYLSYDYSADEELHDLNIQNGDYSFIGIFE